MAATIERRLLVNYRVDPAVAASMLPEGVRPQVVDGSAVAGICLIRLGAFRPAWLPAKIGHRSESAAHRIAVEWDDHGRVRTGVFIPQRHSASRLAQLAGGRIFPGVHAPAQVTSIESPDSLRVTIDAPDVHVDVQVAVVADEQFQSTLFSDLGAASDFFAKDAVGWSPTRSGSLEPLRFDTHQWRVSAGHASHVESSLFDALPPGAAELDHVLVMRDVAVTWTSPRQPAPSASA